MAVGHDINPSMWSDVSASGPALCLQAELEEDIYEVRLSPDRERTTNATPAPVTPT
jgi:hypothetical protein